MNFLGSKKGVIYCNKDLGIYAKNEDCITVQMTYLEIIEQYSRIVCLKFHYNDTFKNIIKQLYKAKGKVNNDDFVKFVKKCAKQLSITQRYVREIINKFINDGICIRNIDCLKISDNYKLFDTNDETEFKQKAIIITYNK